MRTRGYPVERRSPGPPAAPGTARQPRGHWTVFGLVLAALVFALFLQGFDRHENGASSTSEAGARVVGLGGAGPLVDLSGSAIRSVQPPPGEIALTFDDGPLAPWTGAILGILRRQHVPATFFVVGSRALAQPSLVRAERAQGEEIGSHTFTHADLGRISQPRIGFELGLTQTALAGAAGIDTTLLRLPYSSTPADVTTSQLRAARMASGLGYLVVFATQDSQDWRRPGVARIVANALPPGRQGAVIMFHDGGGNRAQTVAALPKVIDALRARGDRFVPVSSMAGLSPAVIDPPATWAAELQGQALLWAARLAIVVTDVLTWLLVPIALLAVVRALVVVILARRHLGTSGGSTPTSLPPVSCVVPAYNEQEGIEATVRSLEASQYPLLEVIVVDDGSTDHTAELVEAMVASGTAPRTTLIRQANAGKPAALNAGIEQAGHDVIVMVDADTVFELTTLARLMGPFADPAVGAVSGNTKVANRRRLLGRWQHIEYVIGFNLDRRMYDVLRCIPTVPGAVGAFRRQALDDVGWVSGDTLAEDTDLTMALQRAGWRVVYEGRAVAWTEAPASLRALWSQRYRWCYGTLQAMWKHRGALRDAPRLGRVGLPYLLAFQVLLPLLAPVIDLFAVYGLVFLDPVPVLAYWLGFNILQLGVGAIAFRVDGERLGSLLAAPLQQFVYRQLMYLVVIQSVISAVGGLRLRWHKLERIGIASAVAQGK